MRRQMVTTMYNKNNYYPVKYKNVHSMFQLHNGSNKCDGNSERNKKYYYKSTQSTGCEHPFMELR